MCKTKPILMYAAVLCAAIIFTAGDAMAFSDEPCSKYNYEYCEEPAMSATNGTWSITLEEDILPGATPGTWVWNYHIESSPGTFVGANFVGFLLPDCCRSDEKIAIDEVASDPDLTCYGVAEGEPTIYFGRYNNQAFVCKGTPDSSGHWSVVANTPYKTRSTIIIKSGKEVLQFEMAVPGCPIAPSPTEPKIGARTFSECTNFGQDTIEDYYIDGELIPAENDDVSFFVIRTDDKDGCVSQIWRCPRHDCMDEDNNTCSSWETCYASGCVEITAGALPPYVVTETSFLRTCPDENITVKMGSPYYLYTFSSGGVTFESCLDLISYKWVDIGFCK